MAKDGKTGEDVPEKKRGRALLIGVPLAFALSGGAFYAVYSGLISVPFLDDSAAGTDAAASGTASRDAGGPEVLEAARNAPFAMPAFVPLEPLVISLGPDDGARHLKVVLSIEADPAQEEAVTAVKPRVADVLNTFLRAVEVSDIAEPAAMVRLRAQMLRRVQLVAPEGSVRDLLVQEFVLN